MSIEAGPACRSLVATVLPGGAMAKRVVGTPTIGRNAVAAAVFPTASKLLPAYFQSSGPSFLNRTAVRRSAPARRLGCTGRNQFYAQQNANRRLPSGGDPRCRRSG